jgi:hypothetical protein
MVCSAVFIPIELMAGAPGHALVQGGLLLAGAALLRHQSRVIARLRTSLPPPTAPVPGHASER